MAAKNHTAAVYRTDAYRWRFQNRNGRIQGTGAEGYGDLHHCLTGLASTLGITSKRDRERVRRLKAGQSVVVRRSGELLKIEVEGGEVDG